MFRSVSQDANMTDDTNDHGNDRPASLSFGAGRRRTRAQAKVDIHARREQLKRTREAMAAMAAKRPSGTPPRTPTRGKQSAIKVGASFGENLTIEHTPPRSGDVVVRRTSTRLHVPEKAVASQPLETKYDGSTSAVSGGGVPRVARLHARGIAQSSSSGGGERPGSAPRKRMISFSPERSERPINEVVERQKRQRNLKATEKLQLRLDGPTPTSTAMRTPEKPTLPPSLSRRSTPTPTPTKSPHGPLRQQLQQQQAKRTASPTTTSGSHAGEVAVAPSPSSMAVQQLSPSQPPQEQPQPQLQLVVRSDTPDSVTSVPTLEISRSDQETEDRALSRASSGTGVATSCKKELDFTVVETTDVTMLNDENKENEPEKNTPENQAQQPQQEEADEEEQEPTASQEQDVLSQPSQASQEDDVSGPSLADGPQHSIGFGASEPFTSTSTIEDVGLFNCELDVEFTGGVYGEGTDGKVSAAMVRGQKVALKRAKPHEGYPEEEAKRRSAVELHYLRRVRHVPGFLQCLGLCDGIEHTCIALEVMDCKLSDYLRRYGQHTKSRVSSSSSSSSASKRRCFTLSLDATKAMLKQICQPMSELHDTVNVAHGDLACRNILLRLPPKGYEQKWEPVVKLSDFGRIKTPASEPPIFGDNFSFYKNCDIGAFAREILYRLLVGEIVPVNCTETRTLHKHLQDVVVERVPEPAKEKLGPYYRLFMRCAGWGVRPSFREIVDHLDDLEYFETSDNGYFPLKPSSTGTGIGTPLGSSMETASFLSPMVSDERGGGGSSRHANGSKHKYETPATANPRGVPTMAPTASATTSGTTGTGVRMLPGKSFADTPSASVAKLPKTVNWLKARSVHPGGGPQPLPKPYVASTPNGRPTTAALARKTPPSAGASRRSLQIINQFQHRLLHDKEKKKAAP